MSFQVDCNEIRALIPSYALGAVDADEMHMMERGLVACPELRAELESYLAMVVQMAQYAPQVEPPASVLDGLLTQARQQKPRMVRRVTGWQAAAAVFLALMIISNLYWVSRTQSIEQRLVALGDAQVLTLKTAQNGQTTGATARLIWQPHTDSAVLMVENFPSGDDTQTFQAWVTRGAAIRSVGMFTVQDGDGLFIFDAQDLLEPFDAFGVTLEPIGGSESPTSLAVVRWQQS